MIQDTILLLKFTRQNIYRLWLTVEPMIQKWKLELTPTPTSTKSTVATPTAQWSTWIGCHNHPIKLIHPRCSQTTAPSTWTTESMINQIKRANRQLPCHQAKCHLYLIMKWRAPNSWVVSMWTKSRKTQLRRSKHICKLNKEFRQTAEMS